MKLVHGVAAVALALVVSSSARAQSPAMQKEIDAVKLDMPRLVAYEKALAAMVKIDKPTLAKANDAALDVAPDEWPAVFAKFPAVVAAVRQGFKSTREYCVVSLAFSAAQFAADKKQKGAPPAEWKKMASAENIVFVEKNRDRVRKAVNAVADRLSAP